MISSTILAAWIMTTSKGVTEFDTKYECEQAVEEYESQFHRIIKKMRHQAKCSHIDESEKHEHEHEHHHDEENPDYF